LIGLGVAVDAKFWNPLPKEFRKRHGNAEEFAFERMLRRIRDMLVQSNDRDFVAIHFDHDREFAKPRLTRYQNIMDHDPWSKSTVTSICFANAWAYPPLQAADMLAWETNKLLEVRYKGAKGSFGNETMFEGPDGIYFSVGEFWDEDMFNRHIDLLNEEAKNPYVPPWVQNP
jgi:hypothetical protein